MGLLIVGSLRVLVLITLSALPFLLSGGPTHQLWQPFALMLVAGVFWGCHIAYNGLESLVSPKVSKEGIRAAGAAGLRFSVFLFVFFGAIRLVYYLDLPTHRLIELAIADLMGIWYAITVYISFFAPYIQDRPHSITLKELPWPKARAYAVRGLACIGFLALMIPIYIELESALFPKFTRAHHAAWKARDERLLQEEASYAKKHCALMPDEQRRTRYREIEAEEYEKRGLK